MIAALLLARVAEWVEKFIGAPFYVGVSGMREFLVAELFAKVAEQRSPADKTADSADKLEQAADKTARPADKPGCPVEETRKAAEQTRKAS